MALPDAGMGFVCLTQRGNWSNSCASPGAHEFCSVGQLVPKAQREPPGSSTSKPWRGREGGRAQKKLCAKVKGGQEGEQTHVTGKTGLRPSQRVNKAERRKRGSRAQLFAMALGGSFVSTETKEMLQPQDVHCFRDVNKVRKNISWQCQTSCEITSSAQDALTCRIVPPGVGGKRNSNARDPTDF